MEEVIKEKKPQKLLALRNILNNPEIDIDLKTNFFKLSAILIVIVSLVFIIGFGIGRFYYPYYPPRVVLPKSVYIGTLYKSSNEQFYIIDSKLETYTLDMPKDLNLSKYVGKQVTVSGGFNQETKLLEIYGASDIEFFTRP